MTKTATEKKYPCTECGADAFVGYSASKAGGDWGGKVKIGERLCTRCFRLRSGFDMFTAGKGRP